MNAPNIKSPNIITNTPPMRVSHIRYGVSPCPIIPARVPNKIKMIATNPVYFLKRNDHEIHKTVSAIRLNRNIDNLLPEDTVNEEFYFKNPKTIEKEWASLPEALESSNYIAANCNTDIKLNEYKFQ